MIAQTVTLSLGWFLAYSQKGCLPSDNFTVSAETYPEDIRNCSLVRGLEGYEGNTVVEGSMTQNTGPEYGILWDVAGCIYTGKNICQALLDSLGISIPHASLDA